MNNVHKIDTFCLYFYRERSIYILMNIEKNNSIQKNKCPDYHERIDQLDAEIINNHCPVDIPIRHLFTEGMYIREMKAPKDSLITSKIHKTQHPFTLSEGKLLVLTEDGEWDEITAPYTGITQPGTRRVAVVVEDCIWTTYHPVQSIKGTENELSNAEQQRIVDSIESIIIDKRANKYLEQDIKKELICHG